NNNFQFGNWSEERGWKFKNEFANKWEFEIDSDAEALDGLKLRVVVLLEEPFVLRAENSIGYEGFCIDLLIEMSQILKFTFSIIEVSDGTYGMEDESGRWSGLVGVLQRHEADLSVSAVTITYSRAEVIDFTLPFMHLGISILLAKNSEDEQKSGLFTFLEPLSFSVWLSLMGSYLLVSCTMWLLAKFSPYEWYDVQQIDSRDRSRDEHKNQFSILNSLWFAVGSLMQQGSDVIPRAAATRIVAVVWWMYTLIMISSYTAQLAAFLTVERMATPIESTADLVNQQKIKYGTLSNGSTMNFFRESKIPIYERMWSVMQSTTPTVFVNSSREGIARAKAGNYAYLMESSMLEYYMERDCQLQRIGGLLDSKGYGIALPKGSPLRDILSRTVLRLQERTILEALKNKWWKDKSGVSPCNQAKDDQITTNSFHNILGIFYILLAGLFTAILLAIGEYCIESRNESYRLKLTIIGKLRSWWDRFWTTSKLEKKRRKLRNIQLDTVHEIERPNCEFNRGVFHRRQRPSKEVVIPYKQVHRLSRMLPMGDKMLVRSRLSIASETLQ
uniref:Ionotropic glutamate receptor C-terminal domain-containing protein n=2 Tax=Parascaris univalens TaxID=6257 RepID=A0A915B0N1_PARUN